MIDPTIRKAVAALAAGAIAVPATAQQADTWWDDRQDEGDVEWSPGEGYHEQEWYDPSDWFEWGDETIDYEYDWWGGDGVRGMRPALPEHRQTYYGGPYVAQPERLGHDPHLRPIDRAETFADEAFYQGAGTGYDHFTTDWHRERSGFNAWYDRGS